MLEEGKILQDRYRVGKQIGQGGMGSVYLATDERFNSTVAIKETLFTDDNYRKAFSREARLLNSLKHTALPKVSDTFIEGNGQYIVMEYIAGDDLFEMLEKSGEAFPLADVMIWAEQLLDALEYLHGQEIPIIHRDIKPQNLKLTPHGQVILLDFGLAKGNPTDANHQTAANSIFGYSRNYASLEQIQGTGTDPRSDIYSLAATLYHLLTGKPPADALTRVMMVLNEEKDPLQKANLIHEQVTDELAEQIEVAMSLNANIRPQSAVEMRELLSGERKTVVSTRPETAANKAAGTNLYTQNTKVFDESRKSTNDSKQSDIQTAVLPVVDSASDSVKTKIKRPTTLSNKNADTQNPDIKSSGLLANKSLLAAAAAGILLLVGSVASMVYLWNPESNLNKEIKSDINVANTTSDVAVTEDFNTNTNLSNVEANSNLPVELTEIEPETETIKTDSIVPKAEPNEKLKTPIKDKKLSSADDKVVINKDIIKADGVKITEGRVETKELIIDENGIRDKKTGKRIEVTNLPKGLTPEQTEKIKEDMKKLRIAEDARIRQAERNKRNREREIEKAKRNRLRDLERQKRLRNIRKPKYPPKPPPPGQRPPM